MHMHLLYINESIVRYIMDTCELTNILCTTACGYQRLVLVFCSSAAAFRQKY